MSASTDLRVKAPDLEAFIARAFEAVEVPSADAKSIAELMTRADLNGSEGHGVFRLPQYIRRIKGGAVNVRPQIRIEREAAAMALVNGDNGMGHLVMRYATRIAIEKAKAAGVAWVGANWSNHAGPASLYASLPLEHDMIGMYFAVGSANHLPPWGGLTDPKRANEGFLLPIGDYKGYGLALVIGLLSGTLNRAAMGRDMVDFNADDTTPTNTGHAIMAISVEAFGAVGEFKRNVDALARDLRGSKRLPGVDRIRLPGEQSRRKRLDHLEHGVPVPPALLASLNALADELNIAPLGS